MSPLLRLAGGADPSAAQRTSSPRSGHRPGATSPASSDVHLARLAGVNLFVFGADDEVTELFTPLWPCLVAPIVVRYRGEPLRLPPASTPVGTIVIYDLDTLTPSEQYALHQWVRGASGRAWVVSTAVAPLFPLVEAGVFDDGLYYRLNAVTIDLTSPLAS